MPSVSFGNFDYVPVLATTEVERMAYGQLRPDTREGILPVFELTRHRGGRDLDDAIQLLRQTVQAPFLLDVDKRYAPAPYQSQNPGNPAAELQRVERETSENDDYNTYLRQTLSPDNGFLNWRAICSAIPNAIPVLQYTNPQSQSMAILRQASLMAQNGNCIAMRIGQIHADALVQLAVQILATLPSSGQLLLIFDCGQGRRGVTEKIDWVLGCLNGVIAGLEPDQVVGLNAVCMSNSYPQMGHDGIRVVENCDRQIWREAYTQFPFAFGDYAASTRTSALSAFLPRSYRATVVHSLDERWLVHRHANADDPAGWREGAELVIAHELFDPIDSWTDRTIQQVAAQNVAGLNMPRPWHAARVAGHIDRQFRYQAGYDEFDDLLG